MARIEKENVAKSYRDMRPRKPVYERPESRGLLIWAFIAFILFWLLVAKCASAQEGIDYEQVIENYINYVHQKVSKVPRFQKRRDWAIENIPLVIKYANKYGLDPLLLACIVYLESSWKVDALGERGERGLLQVMPAPWTKDFDLKTAEGQLDAGAYRLRMAFIQCRNDLKKALTHYASGRCVSKKDRTKSKMEWRVKYFKKMAKKFVHGKITRNQDQRVLQASRSQDD